MRLKLFEKEVEPETSDLYGVLLLLSKVTNKDTFLSHMEKRMGETECKEGKWTLREEKRSPKKTYFPYQEEGQSKTVVPGFSKTDLPSIQRVTGQFNALHVAFPELATDKGAFVFSGSKNSIDKAVKLLTKCFEIGLEPNTTAGFTWLKTLEELNLYCLSNSRNILVDLGIKSTKPWPKKLVERVLGPLPHGMKPGFYEPFLVTLIKGFKPDFQLIYKTFWDALKTHEYEHLDEGFYPPENNEFKKLAKEALKTPNPLEYSPDLLRICVKIAESNRAFFSKGKADRARLLADIQNSIDSVPNTPSAIRVQRQINDLRLILSGNTKLPFADRLILWRKKKPTFDSEALRFIEFDGSSKAIEAAHDFIRVVHRDFSPKEGSAVWHCYVRLVEELNLYCLSTGKCVEWGAEWKSPQVSPKLLFDVVGSKHIKNIESEEFMEFMVNPNNKPYSNSFLLTANAKPYSNRFLIKRALLKPKLGCDTNPNDESISRTNSSQEHTDFASLSNLTDNNPPLSPNSDKPAIPRKPKVSKMRVSIFSKRSGERTNINSDKPAIRPKPTVSLGNKVNTGSAARTQH